MVATLEIDFTADGRYTETVAIMPDAMHDTTQEVAGPRVGEVAETQRVEGCDGAGPHGEDIPVDAAHTGGRTLKGLDGGGVVVRLDLEHHAEAVAYVYQSGVLLACRHEQPTAVARQCLQPADRIFITAMLAPHDGIGR